MCLLVLYIDFWRLYWNIDEDRYNEKDHIICRVIGLFVSVIRTEIVPIEYLYLWKL